MDAMDIDPGRLAGTSAPDNFGNLATGFQVGFWQVLEHDGFPGCSMGPPSLENCQISKYSGGILIIHFLKDPRNSGHLGGGGLEPGCTWPLGWAGLGQNQTTAPKKWFAKKTAWEKNEHLATTPKTPKPSKNIVSAFSEWKVFHAVC